MQVTMVEGHLEHEMMLENQQVEQLEMIVVVDDRCHGGVFHFHGN